MKRGIGVFLLSLLLLLNGCGKIGEQKQTAVQLYYVLLAEDQAGPAIEGEETYIPDRTVESLMTALLKGPTDGNTYRQTFPTGTVLQSWRLEEGRLTLDLSENFGRLSGVELIEAEYCVVMTVSQLDGINDVVLTVNGQNLPGASNQALKVSDVILHGETADPITVSVQLYFPLQEGGVGGEVREFEVNAEEDIEVANAILRQLVSGPTASDLLPCLNSGAQMEAQSILQGNCTVELDRTAIEGIIALGEGYELAIYSIVDSLAELPGVDTVSFTFQGEPIEGWALVYTPCYEF